MRRLTALLVGVFLVTSCAPPTSKVGVGTDQTHFSASRVKDYQTIAQLRADASAVAVVTAGAVASVVPSDEDGVSPIPATITAVRVDQILWGAVPEPQVQVRQMGSASVISDESTPLLQKGRQYVLFLSPFEFRRGVPTGQFTITGDIGDFEVSENGLQRVLPSISSLPKVLSLTELRQQLQGG